MKTKKNTVFKDEAVCSVLELELNIAHSPLLFVLLTIMLFVFSCLC